ncbi:hypothetical protein NE237_031469 [Protea cynaroides]|uniref:F-box domain-containing protein n=1 Tax=Protea cynaroides TaxID=273540 RepID=A0A9Q0L187_9MAGN|nr:hypothetical protein NE237_031469 [Protea cynaroides]
MAKEDEENEKISVEESMPTESLPEVLIVDILSCLPVKSLLRFRCVCKHWYALITDPAFVKTHLSRSLVSNSNLSIIFRNPISHNLNFREFRFNEFNIYPDDLDAFEQQAVAELNYPFKRPHYLSYIVGSCNGLLCIYNSKEEILLWNPSTRRHHKLPFTHIEYGSNIVCGFGHDPTTDDYKIVRIVQLHHALESKVKVYSLNTNSWRRIENMPFFLSYPNSPMLLANSALHWFANREMRRNTTSRFIVSFNLQYEEYREVPLPDFVENNVHMKLGVLGGQLCLLCAFIGVHVEVWLMKDYGVRDYWEKQFSIEQPWVMGNLYYLKPICYSKNGGVILQLMDSNELVLYDPRKGMARNLRIHGVPDYFQTETFVGSLVPVNAKDGTEQAKRKKKHMEHRKKKNMKQEADIESGSLAMN